MKRFCEECGKEARSGDKACIHCGTPYVNHTPRKSTTKKKKLLLSISISIVVIIIAFSAWMVRYQSAEAVEERFQAALAEEKIDKLKSLMIHEDGTSISEAEARAFALLGEENHYINDLYTVVQNGTFLGIFDAYKIEVVGQYASYDEAVEGLSFLFNDEEVMEDKQTDQNVVYGPLAPGVYSLDASFSGKHGETKKTGKLTLSDIDGDVTAIDMSIPVSKVIFKVENADQFNAKKAFIEINGEQFKLDEEGKTKAVGPFIVEGSQKAKVTVEMPWGKVTSKAVKIDQSELSVYADLLSKEQFSAVKETLKVFGEQYVESLSTKSIKPLSHVSNDVKKSVQDNIMENSYYSGKFNQVELDRNSIEVQVEKGQPVIQMDVQYSFDQDYHDLTDKPDLSEEIVVWSVKLSYDGSKKTWNIDSIDYANLWGEIEATDKVDGSKKVHGPSKDTIANAEAVAVEEEISSMIYDYVHASVDAINYRDFDFVESYMTKNGPRRKQARDYIDYLESKGITETVVDLEVEKLEKVNDTTWKVTTIEEFEIHKPDSSNNKKFRTTVIVKKVNDEYLVDELVQTDPI